MDDDKKKIEELEAFVQRLKDTNRKLNRRVTKAEGSKVSYQDKTERWMMVSMNAWSMEFNRMILAHDELKRVFKQLCRIFKYPQNGDSAHSFMDSNVENMVKPAPKKEKQKLKEEGVYANLFTSKNGGIKSYRIVYEVKRAIDELKTYRWHYGPRMERLKVYKFFGYRITITKGK